VPEIPQGRQHGGGHIPDLTVLDAKVTQPSELTQKTYAILSVIAFERTFEEEDITALEPQGRYALHLRGGEIVEQTVCTADCS
jgi:hypothetical protein